MRVPRLLADYFFPLGACVASFYYQSLNIESEILFCVSHKMVSVERGQNHTSSLFSHFLMLSGSRIFSEYMEYILIILRNTRHFVDYITDP